MHNTPDPEAMDEYIADSVSLPDPLQPHGEDAGTLPGPHQPWQPVRVPEEARSIVDGLGPFV